MTGSGSIPIVGGFRGSGGDESGIGEHAQFEVKSCSCFSRTRNIVKTAGTGFLTDSHLVENEKTDFVFLADRARSQLCRTAGCGLFFHLALKAT